MFRTIAMQASIILSKASWMSLLFRLTERVRAFWVCDDGGPIAIDEVSSA